MRIEEKIKLDIKESMINRNKERLSLLRTVIGEFDRHGKNIPDEGAIIIMKKMKDNADDLNDEYESKILSEYLPKILTSESIIKIVEDMFSKKTYTQREMGIFMKEIKTKYGSTIDMKLVSSTFKNLL